MRAGMQRLRILTRGLAWMAGLLLASVCGPAAAVSQAGKNFDHMTTGFALTGQHQSVRCEDCHVRGIFKGTPPQCAACHTPGTLVTAVMIPNNHIPVFQPCDTCHTTNSFYGAHFVHSDVAIGSCATCHNGAFAKGKTPNHIAIGPKVSCDACHTTVSFTTAYLAIPNGHIPTTQPCSLCHSNPAAFVPGVMNHANTAGQCDRCHAPTSTPYTFSIPDVITVNGQSVTLAVDVNRTQVPMSQGGLNATKTTGAVNHIPAAASCDQCHTNGNFTIGSGFKGGAMKHAAVAGTSCAICHNSPTTVFAGTGPGVGGQPLQIPGTVGTPGASNHIPINGLDCGNSGCHAASDTATTGGTGFATHLTPALSATGHTALNLPCATCHTVGMTWKLDSTSLVTPTSAHIPPDNLSSGTVACSSCHSATSFGTGGFKITTSPVLSVGGHAAVSTMTCATCHEASAADLTFQGVLGNIYLRPNTATSGLSKGVGQDPYHGSGMALTQDCASCHVTTPPFASAIAPSGHIPLKSGAACADCHSAGYSPTTTVMRHADAAGTCASCHNTNTVFLGTAPGSGGGQPWQMSGTAGINGTSTTHMPTGTLDCANSGCHAVSDTMTTNGGQFQLTGTPALSATGHTAVNLPCATCHTIGMSWKGLTTIVTPAAAHIPPDNLSSGAVACSSCHSATSFGTGGFKITTSPVLSVAGHASISTLACTTCHEANSADLLFQGVQGQIYLRPDTATSGLSKGAGLDVYHGTGNAATQDCSVCHSTAPPFTSTTLPPNHIKLNSTSVSCNDCHAAGYGPGVSTMKHSDVTVATPACGACHNTNASFIGTGQGTLGQPWQASGTAGINGTSTTHIPMGSLDCANSGCHAVSDTMTTNGASFQLTGTPALSATGHTAVNLPCATCHTVGMSWKGLTTIVTPAAAHIPPDNLSSGAVACSSCHSATSFGTGGFKITTSPVLSVAGHASISTLACTTCHEANSADLLFQGVQGQIYLRPDTATSGLSKGAGLDVYHGTGNAATQDCSVCHSTAPPFTSTTLPPNHIKLNSTSVSCNDCHAAGYGPGVSTMKHSDVTVATPACGACHNTNASFIGTGQGTLGQPWQASGTAGINGTSTTHIPMGSLDCANSGCHAVSDTMTTNGASFQLTGTPALSATGHTALNLACATCHAAGMTWKGITAMVGATTAHIPPDNSASPSIACSSCHSATSFGTGGFKLTGMPGGAGAVMTPAMHATVASAIPACLTCHEANAADLTFQGVVGQIYLRPNTATSGLSLNPDAAHGAGNALTGDCGGCHGTTGPFQGGTLPSNHIPLNTPTPACADCHASGYAPGVSGMKHADVSTNCALCHNTTTVFSGTGQGTNGQPWQIPGTVGTPGANNHIPIGTLNCNNSGCHAVSDTLTSTGAGFVTGTTPALSAAGHTALASLACATCHTLNMTWKIGTATLVTPASNHIPPDNTTTPTVACSACHSATNIVAGGFKLTGTPGTASPVMNVAMHSAVSSAGLSCDSCHESANLSPGDLLFQGVAGQIYLRPNNGANSGLSQATDTAHTGTAATADCSGCHTTTPPFSAATSLPAGHIPLLSGAACTTCHTTGAFNSAAVPLPHTGVISGGANACSSCHSGQSFTGLTPALYGTTYTNQTFTPTQISTKISVATGSPGGHIPLPSGDDCGTCHAVPTSALAGFGPGTAMVHTGISSGCATCHSAGATWYGVSYTATILIRGGGAAIGTPVHVPILNSTGGNADCSICHSTSVFTSFGTTTTVNHTSTFLTITGSGRTQVSAPTCKSCHGPSGQKWYNASLSTATVGSHQGSTTSQDCIDCHSVSSFNNAAAAAAVARRPVMHVAGGMALRPGALPPATGTGTGTGTGAAAAVPFTHVGVLPGGCASCHSPAGGAPTQPANHLPTTLSCDTCHRTSSWLPAIFAHNGVAAGSCGTCHTGNWATAKPAVHMLTSRTCDTCHHGTTSWTPETYSHLDLIYTPHPANVGCIACHSLNTEQIVWKFANFKPGCAGCHGPQFSSTPNMHRSRGPAVTPARGPQ
jgi:hypothetical protein